MVNHNQPKCQSKEVRETGGAAYTFSGSCITSLPTNGRVQIRVACNPATAATTLTIGCINLTISQV